MDENLRLGIESFSLGCRLRVMNKILTSDLRKIHFCVYDSYVPSSHVLLTIDMESDDVEMC